MTRITTSRDMKFKRIPRIIPVEFQYDDGYGGIFDVNAEVEVEGDSYTVSHHNHPDECPVGSWRDREICEMAEEKARDIDDAPRNASGCECISNTDGILRRADHDEFCPLRLSAEERAVYDEMRHDEQRDERAVRGIEK